MFTILALMMFSDQFTVEVLPFVQRFTVVVIEPAKVVERRPPVVAAPVVPVRRQRYLVSEPWCGHCPAAKKRFLGIGWPDSNVITIDECERRFGFRPKSIPYEFDEPVQSPSVKAVKPVKTSLRSMSHREMVQLHNNLHGGIPHTWPGDLATHLQTVHGQY